MLLLVKCSYFVANVTIQCFYKASDPSLSVCWLPLCPSRCTFVSAVQTELLLKADKCEGGQGGRVGLGSVKQRREVGVRIMC